MSKQQVIDVIRRHNPTAHVEFLNTFNLRTLESYLKRLTDLDGCRGPGSVWVREGDTPAIVTSTH